MSRWWMIVPMSFALGLVAQQPEAATQLTIYNQDFAVARTTVPLDLHSGETEVLTTRVTSMLEPDSVILRDPSSHHAFKVMEQNYDAAVVTQQWMLEKFEGQTIDFEVQGAGGVDPATGMPRPPQPQIIKGRIVRAGSQPLIEVDGHLQFSLPGMPLFPASTDGLLLKPTLRWQIESAKAAQFPAELDYITRGMSWQATYNVVVPESKDVTGPELADILGWVTINNTSGSDFDKATIQLMAGDVAKIINSNGIMGGMGYAMKAMEMDQMAAAPPQVTQKAFDDFHLYDLHRTVSLRNGETKQVQFLEASGVTVQRTYQFNGNDSNFRNFYSGYHDENRANGASGTKVQIREEIRNAEANHLGMPLPSGRLRLYRRETSGQLQFVGESMIEHTAADQTVQVVSGEAFDLKAERRQTDFHVNNNGHTIDEAFEVVLSNAKDVPVVIHDVERMNRAENWAITDKSGDFSKKDSHTIDFPVTVPAKGQARLTYTVHYTW